MKPLVLIISLFITISPLDAQDLSYSPEFFLGNRSGAYQHLINLSLSEKWSMNNLALFDSDYQEEENNIFFIRNSVGYKLSNLIQLNGGVGIKNPGSFFTGSAQFRLKKNDINLTYSIGSTYQESFTLEQVLFLKYTPKASGSFKPFLKLFIVMNTNFETIDRSLQQLRLGIDKDLASLGFAANLDQFANGSKTLENIGVFFKYNF